MEEHAERGSAWILKDMKRLYCVCVWACDEAESDNKKKKMNEFSSLTWLFIPDAGSEMQFFKMYVRLTRERERSDKILRGQKYVDSQTLCHSWTFLSTGFHL